MWHTDSSFKRVPAHASLLSGREVPPEGGETEFASMRVAYERLPEAMRRSLEGKVAIHSFEYSRGLVGEGLLPPDDAAQVPPVPQALVRANPVNGRKAFFVASHACEIVGMPTDEARALIRDLLERHGPDRVYTHRWRPGDLVMWDNRCVLHRGRPWNESRYRRVMHRTTVAARGRRPARSRGSVWLRPARATSPGARSARGQLGGSPMHRRTICERSPPDCAPS